MTKEISTVAVKTPRKAMPVPGVERMVGFTTTMYDIVKKVVMPAIASVRRVIGDRLQVAQDIRTHKPRITRICAIGFTLIRLIRGLLSACKEFPNFCGLRYFGCSLVSDDDYDALLFSSGDSVLV